MTAFTDNERRVVPRWREFHETLLDSSELSHHTSSTKVADPVGELERLELIWRECPDPISAYDFVSTATVLGRMSEAQDAIDFLRQNNDVPGNVRAVTFSDPDAFKDSKLSDLTLHDFRKIRYLKDVLQKWPRNAICWTQLGLFYSRVGENKKAKRCIEIGLFLAPHSRYVLRSACRFFVHVDDASRAVWELRRSERTMKDPWLMAAEISCSQILGRSSPNLNSAISVLERKRLPPWSVTELAASVGTNELESGSRRKAKRNFRAGAEAPNGNVKAQLQWLRINHSEVYPSNLSLKDSLDDHEACALGLRADKNWSGAISSCEEWGNDEFFSERPFCLGSYIAIEALGDVIRAESIVREGLIANREDTALLNHLAISLAMQGKLEESRSTLAQAEKKAINSPVENKMALTATSGLVDYRSGEIEKGREKYLKAIRMAVESESGEEARRAALYMVLEELEAATEESVLLSRAVVNKIEKTGASADWPERDALLTRVRQAVKGRRDISGVTEGEPLNEVIDLVP